MASAPLRDLCLNRWPNLLPLVGVSPDFLSGKHCACPMCGGKDRFRFDNKDGAGTWICSQCGAGDGISLVMQVRHVGFKDAAELLESVLGEAKPVATRRERSEDQLRQAMERLWSSAVSVGAHDPVGLYLASRAIRLPSYPLSLRYAEKCRYQADEPVYYPAMVAKVVSPDGRQAVTVHRTYLTPEGRKAPVDAPRRLMPGKLIKGSAVRLGPVAEVMGIAEGIETALSAAAIFGLPVWAALNAGMLMAWEPPEGVREVIVFGDNDATFAGQSAAYALAHRLAAGPRRIATRVELPPDIGMDWNDVAMAERVEAA